MQRRTAGADGRCGPRSGSSRSASSTSSSNEVQRSSAAALAAERGQSETMATMSAAASVAVPRARWSVTIAGSFSEVIVTAPTTTCVASTAKLTMDNVTRRISDRNHRMAASRVKRTKRPVSTATRRCTYSTKTPASPTLGTSDPLQSGQSGHASPAPIPRTVPPRTIVAYAKTAPRIAIVRRNRRRSIRMRALPREKVPLDKLSQRMASAPMGPGERISLEKRILAVVYGDVDAHGGKAVRDEDRVGLRGSEEPAHEDLVGSDVGDEQVFRP